MSVAEWYLVVEGTKTGPYTPEQISGLLQDGEILGHHRAMSERLNGESISVKELVVAFQKAVSESFQPPPRPIEIDSASTIVPPLPEGQDTTQNLFDALKVAKEKQAQATPGTRSSALLAQEVAQAARRANELKPQIVLILVLGIAFFVAVFALTRLLRNESPAPESSKKAPSFQGSPPQGTPQTLVPLNPPVQSKVPPRTLPRNAPPVSNPRFPPGGGAIRQGDNEPPPPRPEEPRDPREADHRERERLGDLQRDNNLLANPPSNLQEEANGLQRAPLDPNAAGRELPPGSGDPGAPPPPPPPGAGSPEGVAPDAQTQ